MLSAKCLRKVTIPGSLLRQPSPASIQPTRLSLLVNQEDSICSSYFASGCQIYKVEISMEDSLLNQGKDSLLLPDCDEVIRSSVIDRYPHRYEIQSIALVEKGSTGSYILGSVDSYGHLVVSELDTDGRDVQKLKFAISPKDRGVGEGSWAGLSFNQTDWSMVAVARSFPKCIDIYDQEFHLRNFRTLSFPSSVTFLQNQFCGTESSVLAVTEGCQLTVWDLRMKENGGCLQRISGSPGENLYTTSVSSRGNIAVAGADRTVSVYDPRRWSAISRWIHCSKYKITGLAFSSVDPDSIYVQGVDYEVFCGEWSKGAKSLSFRGDSNWLGFTKCPNRDVLGGWCDSGSMFVAHIAPKKDV